MGIITRRDSTPPPNELSASTLLAPIIFGI